MGVVWVRQIANREWSDDDTGNQKGRRVFKVLCSDKLADGPETAAAVCPEPGAPYKEGSSILATARSVEELEVTANGGVVYKVTIEYSTKGEDPETSNPNPLARPLVMKMSFDSTEYDVHQAETAPEIVDSEGVFDGTASSEWYYGKTLVNSAGSAYEPAIKEITRDPVLTITKNVGVIPFNDILEYMDTVNSSPFTIVYRGNSYEIDAEQAWIYDLSTEPAYENDTYYEVLTAVVKLRKDTWQRKFLDKGFAGYKDVDHNANKPAPPILDESGDPVVTPVLLNGRGCPLADGDPKFIKWMFKKRKDFGGLSFWSDV